MAAKAPLASSNDPDGLLRLERSRAQTSKGLKRLANAIIRDAIGIPLTRKQRAEIRAQGPKLDPRDIDKNIYRTPPFRQRSPKDMQNRRKPGWTDCQFVLPRVTLEGLSHLAIWQIRSGGSVRGLLVAFGGAIQKRKTISS